MMNHNHTLIPTLCLLLIASPLAFALDTNTTTTPMDNAFLSVTLDGLEATSPNDAPIRVGLVLETDGREVARETRDLTPTNGTASLAGLSATALAGPEGGLAQHLLGVRISIDGQEGLSVAGRAVQDANGTWGFRVASMTWPSQSRIAPTSDTVLQFAQGWDSDNMTVAFVPAPGVNVTGLRVRMQAWSAGAPNEGVLVFDQEVDAMFDPRGVGIARFNLDHLPPKLKWNATILGPTGVPASVYGRVDFPAGRSDSTGYEPGIPRLVVGAASGHDVKHHDDAAALPRSALTVTYPITRTDGDASGFNWVLGSNASLLSEVIEGPAKQPTTPSPQPPTPDPDPDPHPGNESIDVPDEGSGPSWVDLAKATVATRALVIALVAIFVLVCAGWLFTRHKEA